MEDETIPADLAQTIRQLLRYSFLDVSFSYEGLTNTEKALLTEQQFERLMAWIGERKKAA
jgi:hypothetical protein